MYKLNAYNLTWFITTNNHELDVFQSMDGRGGPVAWPVLSPDLPSLGFFIWDRMKPLVYETAVESELDLVATTEAAAAVITEQLQEINPLRRSLMNRFQLCAETEDILSTYCK